MEMKLKFVTHRGFPTYYRQMIYKFIKGHAQENKICHMCRNKIQYDQNVYLLINNYKLFPNVLVHKKCFDEMGPQNSVIFLYNDYQEALKYKHWFF